MMSSLQSIFKIPELRKRILFTISILVIYRIGGHIPTPGLNADALGEWFRSAAEAGTLFGLYDMFVGGALSRASVFALGIMPYISASIIIQLLGAVVPYFQRLQKEGEEGRKKITQLTRYGTVGICVMQGWGMSIFLQNIPALQSGRQIVANPGLGFMILTVQVV